MPKQQIGFDGLLNYIPLDSFDLVCNAIIEHKIHFTITRKRATMLGTYQAPRLGKNHRITVNGNLNKYSFLITFLHELAHLKTFILYGNKVKPHGKEWKTEYKKILAEYIIRNIFPNDIKMELLASIENMGASTNSEYELMKVLKKYDTQQQVHTHTAIENIKNGQLFKTQDGRIFKMHEKLRTRYKAEEISTKRLYLFNALYEVEILID